MNALSHRAEHEIGALQVALAAAREGRKATGDEYRTARKAVAACRRREQQRARLAAGTDRATIRAAYQQHRP